MCLSPSKVFDKRRSKSNELFLIEYKMGWSMDYYVHTEWHEFPRGNQGPIL